MREGSGIACTIAASRERRIWCFADIAQSASFTGASGTATQGVGTRPRQPPERNSGRRNFVPTWERDGRNRHELLEDGWRVAIVWECALRRRGQVETAANLERWLRGDEATFETNRSDDG